MTLTEYVNELNSENRTLVVIGERGHQIFNDGDKIEQGWADNFDVTEIISVAKTSAVIRVEYNVPF